MTEIPIEVWEAVGVILTALASYMAYRTRTNTGKITAIEEKVEQQLQTLAIVDPNAEVAGKWSPEAKEALDKAIPAGAEIIKIDDAPTYHIVYWRIKY